VLEVACAVEGARYVAHCATMLRSLQVQHPQGVRIHLFHGPDLTDRRKARLAEMVRAGGGEISFRFVPDAMLAGLPTRGFTRKATWYRIFLPELLEGLDRVLYLDSDLIVVDDLAPLWDTPLGDHYLAAVTNVLEPEYSDRPGELGIHEPNSYFNAGVMLMNLAAMRADDCTEALLAFGTREAPRLLWRDQDALNVVLGARRLHLHPRWNCMNIFRFEWAEEVHGPVALAEAVRDPAIRHFEGPDENKPWHFSSSPGQRRLYAQYRRQTPWPRHRPTGVTPRAIARRARERVAAFRA
jgi:lipopolysaccharide biosynthesis glycosyltransferase